MVRFGSSSGQPMFSQIRSSCQNKQLCEKFRVGYGSFGSIRVSGPLSGEHISGVGSGMGLGSSVWVAGLGSVLPGLVGSKTENNPK